MIQKNDDINNKHSLKTTIYIEYKMAILVVVIEKTWLLKQIIKASWE